MHVIGVDISDAIINENMSRYPGVEFMTLDQYIKSDVIVDHIVTTHTVEHVDAPADLVEDFINIAQKDVTVIVPYKDSWIECEEHMWMFDETSFQNISVRPIVIMGKTNKAGNTELLFYFCKNEEKKERVRKAISRKKRYPRYRYKLFWFLRKRFPENMKELFRIA